MKRLFERFEKQSQDLEIILEKSIGLVRERKNLNEDLCKEIGSALKGLRSVYDEITMKLPEKAGGITVPEGASVKEIEAMWQESVSAKQGELKEVLSEFIRVYSDDAKYQEAIEEQLTMAKNLLIILEKEEKADPDVSSYARFLEYVKADLDKDEELADKLDDEGIEGFSDRAIKGLRRKKYYIREDGEASKEPSADSESEQDEQVDESSVSEDTDNETKENTASSIVEDDEESEATEDSTEPVEYLHPKKPIIAAKVPSEQKFDDLLKKTDRLFGFLYDNLTFIGLLDKERAIAHMDEHDILNSERSEELLDYMESKGFICTYEYDGREILCATELLYECLAKKSFQSLMKRRLDLKDGKNCILYGVQDFEKKPFEEHLRLANLYIDFVDKLNENEVYSNFLPKARWDKEIGKYFMICPYKPTDDSKELVLMLLSPEEMMSREAQTGDMMICYSPELPKIENYVENVLYMCLTDDGLFLTVNGEWTRIEDTNPEDENGESIDLSEDENSELVKDSDEEATLTDEDVDAVLTAFSSSDVTSEVKPEESEAAKDQTNTASEPETEALPVDKKTKASVAKKDPKVETSQPKDKPAEIPPVLSASEQHVIKAKGAFAVQRVDVGNVILKGVSKIDEKYVPLAKQYSFATGDPDNTEDYRPSNLLKYFPEGNGKDQENDLLFMASWLRMFFSVEASFESYLASEKKHMEGNLSNRFAPSLTDAVNELADWTKNQGRGLDQDLLASALKHSGIADRLADTRKRAAEMIESGELLRSTHYNNRIRGTREKLFGRNSDIYRQLQVVIQDDRSLFQKMKSELEEYVIVENGAVSVNEDAIDDLMDDAWRSTVSLAKGKGQSDALTGVERNTLRYKLISVYKLLGTWLLAAGTSKTVSSAGSTSVVSLVDRVKPLLKQAIKELETSVDDFPELYGPQAVLQFTLKELLQRIRCEYNETTERKYYYAQLMKEPFVALDEDYMPYIESPKEQMVPYEFCERAEQYLLADDKPWEDVIKRIFNPDEARNGGDYGVARLLKAYLNEMHPDVHWPAEYDIDRAVERALDKNSKRGDSLLLWEKNFTARLEMADGDGWFKTTSSREKIDRIRNANYEAYCLQENFGFYGRKLNHILEVIKSRAPEQRPAYMVRLEKLKESLSDEDLSAPVLAKIEKLINDDRFGAAESYLQQVERGTLELRNNGLGDPNSEFNKFIKNCGVLCWDAALGKKMVDAFRVQHKGLSNRNVKTGDDLLASWPESRVHPDVIKRLLSDLGLETERVTGDRQDNHYHAFFPDKGRIENYPHPIADFGSNMFKFGLDIDLVFGAKNSDELFTEINAILQKTSSKPVLILCNFAIPLQERRKLAKKIAGNLRTTAPCLLVDRALVYYLADCALSERWKIMIQCALPFQPAQLQNPYFENSSVVIPPDMFIGRRDELESIISPAGANLIYGGRQLGKTALLQRARTLQHQPISGSYSVYVDIKNMDATEAAKTIGKSLIQCSFLMQDTKIKNWTDLVEAIESRLMTRSLMDHRLLLLVDEADHFLVEIESNKYKELDQFKRLQGTTEGRFKFVMAGLHNVLRFSQKALAENSGLPQLEGKTVKPLSFADARELLEMPLSYLGFMIRSGEEDVIAQILYNTNYFPGLVHFYASRLVKHMQKNIQQASMPPYMLDREVLVRILADDDFRQQRVQRLKMTLGIDADQHSYYDALAHILCYYSLEYEEVMLYGMTAEEVRKECKGLAPNSSIAKLDEQSIGALLDELVELNILRPEITEGKKRYLFSRTSFIEMLGTKDAVESHLLEILEK